MKQPFIPRKQSDYVKWHDNLKNNVTATTPGATAADVTMLAADNADLHAKITAADNADNAAKAAHAALCITLGSGQGNARGLAGRIKKSTGYTLELGTTLELEGVESSVDLHTQQPKLKAEAKANGGMEVGFDKLGGLVEGVHLYGMRDGEAGFSYLASETHSPYIDNRPLLVAGKPETRNYKAVYFVGKTEVGQESAIVQATARP